MKRFVPYAPTGQRRPFGEKREVGKKAVGIAAAISTILSMAALTSPAFATDTLPWGRVANEEAAGVHQPYQHGYTGLDILKWSPAADADSAYLRSRVPLQKRIPANAQSQRDPSKPADTQMFNLAGDYGNAFFESFHDNNVFSQYLFNYWQYVDYQGSWHGMPTAGVDKKLYDPDKDWTQKWFEFGTMNLPNAAYTNAAHKNGVKSIATIFMSNNDRGEQTYRDLLQGRKADGTFPVAKKLVEIAKYYGIDGYFINQESDVDKADIPAYEDFIAQMRHDGLYVQWYDAATKDGKVNYQNELNSENSDYLRKDGRDNANSIFLNYWYDNDMLKRSAAYARHLGLDPKQSVFAGMEIGGHKFAEIGVNSQAMESNLGSDGKPLNSIAGLGTDFVSSELGDDKKIYPQYQNEVFDRERRLWTGSSDGTGDDIQDDWKGFSSQIAARSVISGSTFTTDFNTGHGLEWRDQGKRTSSRQWGNINLQDIPVTWQWWITSEGEGNPTLKADFDYGSDYVPATRFNYRRIGAYTGGDSLVLSGDLKSTNTIRLFKTDLSVTPKSSISLVYNKPSSDSSHLFAVLMFTDDPTHPVRVPLADGEKTDGWKTVQADLSAYANRHIAQIGLAVDPQGSDIQNYQVNIGELSIHDGKNYTPAAPTGLTLSKVFTDTSEAVVKWNIAPYDSVKNYLLYMGDTFIGGRYDDVLYIKHLPARQGMLHLYAVGADGTRSAAASLPINLDSAASNVAVNVTRAPGSAVVSWNAPVSRETKVSLRSASGSWRYASHPYSATMTVPAGTTSARFTNVPVDGSRYVVTVWSSQTPSTAESTFLDKTIEAYPVCEVTYVKQQGKDAVKLVRPETQDWRYLRIRRTLADGRVENVGAYYTYSQQTPPIKGIIRGRTVPQSYLVPTQNGTISVQVEDYAGNKSKWQVIPSKDQLSHCSASDESQPSVDQSSTEVVTDKQVADGQHADRIRVSVKDKFGNPLIGTSVRVTMPSALNSEGATSHEGTKVKDVTVGSDGSVEIPVTSQTDGTYQIDFVSGAVALKSAKVSYTPKPAEPTNPDKPSNPDKPTNPSKPSHPSEPSKPSKPSNPSKPSHPTNPSSRHENQSQRSTQKGSQANKKVGQTAQKPAHRAAQQTSAHQALAHTGAAIFTVLAIAIILLAAGAAVTVMARGRRKK